MLFYRGRGNSRKLVMTVPGSLYAKAPEPEQIAVRSYLFGQDSPLAQAVLPDGGTTFVNPVQAVA